MLKLLIMLSMYHVMIHCQHVCYKRAQSNSCLKAEQKEQQELYLFSEGNGIVF